MSSSVLCQHFKMCATSVVFLIALWIEQGTANNVNTTPTMTPIRRPINCQDIIQHGKTYEGHYVVYPESTAPNKATMVYCSQGDGIAALPRDMVNKEPMRNCLDLLRVGRRTSEPSIIYPRLDRPADPVLVSCDQETDGGGWTVIQKRDDGTENFYRPWTEYSSGFGNVGVEHYLGNENIHAITDQSLTELRVELEDWDGVTAYAHYELFHLSSASDKYRMEVDFYEGTAGNSLHYSTGYTFSTFDADNDDWNSNCAEIRHSGWWYKSCTYANLNGRYYLSADSDNGTGPSDSMYWYDFRGFDSLKSSTMMIRPHPYTSPNLTERSHQDQDDVSNFKQYVV